MCEFAPMQYKVMKDMPGYLRVRYGSLAFDKEQGYGIAEALRRVGGVNDVVTAPANGSVLVRYDEADERCRELVLECLSGFDRDDLPVARPDDGQLRRDVDPEFALKVAVKAVGYAARRLLLPPPLRYAWTIFRSLGYIHKGLYHLVGKRELSVEVLDATAITASMLTGMFDSAGSVMLLLDISELLENYTHARSRMALESSLALNIDEVWLVTDHGDVLVSIDELHVGDLVRVRTGAMIPVDGEVVEGEAAVNEASMTGESALVLKDKDATVYAGTVVDEGDIVVCARKVGSDTRIRSIVDMVDESEQLKAGAQSRAERLADAIVPFNLLAFFGVLFVTRNMVKAMSVLMVDYSCAIKISTPVAVMSAMREAANYGMVVKGGKYLETIAEADTIIFDKTGTLTTAQPEVKRVIVFGDSEEDEVLCLAACLEEHFPHSMAHAVVNEAKKRGINHTEEAHAEVKYVVAHGIASAVDGKHVVLGSAHYVFEDEGVKPPARYKQVIARRAPGCSVIYLAVDGILEGALAITDPVREEAFGTIARLREAGFTNIMMLTGDAENAARAQARKLGIYEYRSQVLPEYKAGIVQELRDAGHKVVMVGDGVNDSPALAAADCSIAMLDASDIAREVADVTLLNSSLEEILNLRELSQKLMTRISRKYRIIVGFNSALLVGGVAGILQPTLSALLHNGSTMLITASNMRPLLKDY